MDYINHYLKYCINEIINQTKFLYNHKISLTIIFVQSIESTAIVQDIDRRLRFQDLLNGFNAETMQRKSKSNIMGISVPKKISTQSKKA